MTLLFPVFAIFWAFFWSQVHEYMPQNIITKKIFKLILIVYAVVEGFE
jgi:hypothetical protein